MIMAQETLYLKLDRNVELQKDEVNLSDLGKLYCRNHEILARAKAMHVLRFHEKDPKRQVLSVMKLIAKIQGQFQNVEVENIGESEVVIERVKANKYKGPLQWLKIIFVCGICFFGSSFTIMAFHNDVNISRVFIQIYEMLTGETSEGYTILEFSYSIGLSLGILVFFNHIGGRRITKDPTPIEVEMRIYENDVNNSLVKTAKREGKIIDVE